MSIFCDTVPLSNFERRYNWEKHREYLRYCMRMKLGTGRAFYLDMFHEMKRREREKQRCRNARKGGKAEITPRSRLQPPYLNQRPSLLCRFLLAWQA